ncbi:MAG TPA: hypothetical protein DEH78_02125 [Solibacterales bacterium]|nr:hypothetical protein [Bryobacterales bacterium]
MDLGGGHAGRATFFQIGGNARRLPAVSRAVAAAGHEIGNHTETHARLWLRGQTFLREEIGRGQRSIEDAAGVSPRLFRPPYGVRWPGLGGVLDEMGLTGVLWSAIGRDWKDGAPAVSRRLLRGLRNGAILCLHDGRERAARPETGATADALEAVLIALRAKGLQCVTVSELIA